jgi:pilus assembly protein Flp/PilA
MERIATLVRNFAQDEEAATMTEYGIMVALIAAISIGIVTLLGQKVLAAFTTVNGAMP